MYYQKLYTNMVEAPLGELYSTLFVLKLPTSLEGLLSSHLVDR